MPCLFLGYSDIPRLGEYLEVDDGILPGMWDFMRHIWLSTVGMEFEHGMIISQRLSRDVMANQWRIADIIGRQSTSTRGGYKWRFKYGKSPYSLAESMLQDDSPAIK